MKAIVAKNCSFAAMHAEQNTYKPTVSLIDENFSEALTAEYHLSMELSVNGICYTIYHPQKNRYLLLETFTFHKVYSTVLLLNEIRSIIETHSFLRKNFKSISISLFSSKFTLIPTALFDRALADKYLEFNSPVEEDESILIDELKNFDTQCVYAISKNLMDCLQELFPKAKFLHVLSPLLESLASSFKNSSGKKVVIHLQQSHFEMVVMEEKKLLFANIFNYQSSEDFLYYTLFVCEQLKLNPENIELILVGEVEKNSAIYSILNKYIRNIKFGNRPELLEYSYVFDSISSHFYFNLFSQNLCV